MENFILNGDFFDATIVRIPEEAPDESFCSGSNQKKLLIVSDIEDANQSTDVTFLAKIFESVNINLERDALLMILTQNKEFSWVSITKLVEFDHLVFFGKSPKKIGLQFDFQWYRVFDHQQRHFLIAEPLDQIASDRSKKGALWSALKQMFLEKEN